MALSRRLTIDVLDRDGNETGRSVPVDVEYHLEVDSHYGADADGNRGIRMVEYVIDKVEIPEDHKKNLLEEEVKQVIESAEIEFDEMP